MLSSVLRRAGAGIVALFLATAGVGCTCTCGGPGAPDAGDGLDGGGTGCTAVASYCEVCSALTPMGSPDWDIGSVEFFSGNFGTMADSYAAAAGTFNEIVMPEHVATAAGGYWDFGIQHPAPYEPEMVTKMCASGHPPADTFSVAEFSAPNAVAFFVVLVPQGGVTGSSPDFADGPIIPNTLFPMSASGDMYKDGMLYDAVFDVTFPALYALPVPRTEDGWSHYVASFIESDEWAPAGTTSYTGVYELHMTITDALGNGWFFLATFTVQ